MKRFSANFRQCPRFIALLLCFWLSGAVCAFHCGAAEMRAHHQTEKADVVSCHLHSSHESEPDENDDETSKFSRAAQIFCCPLLPISVEAAKKFQSPVFASQTAAKSEIPQPTFSQREFRFQPDYKPILLNRGSTHLRNCVFRI